jgi:rubrerythrin
MRAKDAAKFCGRSCYGVWKVKAHDERWSELRHAKEAERARLAVVQPELDALHRMARYVERPSRRKCAGCDALVINRKWARFCPSCREAGKKSAARRLKLTPAYKALKLKHKTLRRARQEIEAEAVNPYVVFHKAGWKCQICGVDTPRRLRGTYEPNAPELDHIVPLAKGGGHTWANVQCSCRRCNGAKGASLAA